MIGLCDWRSIKKMSWLRNLFILLIDLKHHQLLQKRGRIVYCRPPENNINVGVCCVELGDLCGLLERHSSRNKHNHLCAERVCAHFSNERIGWNNVSLVLDVAIVSAAISRTS